jgi:predicted metal-dependent hydrolase
MRRRRNDATARGAQGNPLQMPLWKPRDSSPGWDVRISRRARRLSMRVFPGGRIEVVVPPGVGIPAIERFVSRHREWAERRAREFTLLVPQGASRRPTVVELALLERSWRVEYETAKRAAVHEPGDGRLRICGPEHTDESVSRALMRWLSGLAATELGGRLAKLSQELGIDYARMHLRRQRTRWGSCSAAGTISLNVCLMFQRPAVVRYLLVHELCHRRHLDHSDRYWRLVQSYEPDWRALDAELLQGWRNVPAWVFPS